MWCGDGSPAGYIYMRSLGPMLRILRHRDYTSVEEDVEVDRSDPGDCLAAAKEWATLDRSTTTTMDDNAEAPATLSTPSAPPTPNENAARFGNTGHIHFHSNVEKPRPRKVADLVSKPVIRQWIAGGKLYREESSREMPRIELFFDLLYVGVIHQLGV